MKRLVYFLLAIFIYSCNSLPDSDLASDYSRKSSILIDSLIKESDNQYYSNNRNIEVFDSILKEAVELAKLSDKDSTLFDLYINVARRYRQKAEYGKSLIVLQDAKSIAEELDSDMYRAYATQEMAVNYRRMDDNGEALKLHTQALEWAESARDTFLIHCSYNGIGNVYFVYKNYPKAIEYFNHSLEYSGVNNPNVLGEAINTNTIGESWLYLGQLDSALVYLKRSFNINVKLGSKLGQGICYNGIGLVYHKMGEFTKAEKAFNSSLKIHRKQGDLFYMSMSLNSLGKTYLALGKNSEACMVLEESVSISQKIGSKNQVVEAAVELAKLYSQEGITEVALKYTNLGLAYKDSITAELIAQNTQAINVLYKAEKQEREIIILKQNAELSKLKLSKQKYYLASGILVVLTILLIAYLILRQRELVSKYKEMGLQQRLFRAQMNPHFIFNSLTAIQFFIMQNNKLEASDYLANFSRLMRNILLGSRQNTISIEDDVAILNDYLKLQKLRFRNSFEYNIDIHDSVDSEGTLVPPMLVQPFVENAVEHGFRSIDYKGVLSVSYAHKKDSLFVEIIDNGIGLKASNRGELKSKHTALATKITHQRMLTLQVLTKEKCKLEVINRADISNRTGVIVRISIPYNLV